MWVSQDWINFAHGPAAEDGQPLAVRLVEMTDGYTGSVKVTEPELIEELKSVAELYTHDTTVQDPTNPLWFRAYPRKLIARCKLELERLEAKPAEREPSRAELVKLLREAKSMIYVLTAGDFDNGDDNIARHAGKVHDRLQAAIERLEKAR